MFRSVRFPGARIPGGRLAWSRIRSRPHRSHTHSEVDDAREGVPTVATTNTGLAHVGTTASPWDPRAFLTARHEHAEVCETGSHNFLMPRCGTTGG